MVVKEGYPKAISPPTTIFANYQKAVKLTKNPEYHRKTKHIPIKYHKTRKLVAEGVVLGIYKFGKFVEMLGMIDR